MRIVGAERSGTNLLEYMLVEVGFEVISDNKHGRQPEGVRFVLIYKDPLAWADSLHRYGVLYSWMGLTEREREISDLPLGQREQSQLDASLPFEEFCEQRRVFEHWASVHEIWARQAGVVVSYENMLWNVNRELDRVGRAFGQRPSRLHELPSKQMDTAAAPTAMPFAAESYYLNRKYLSRYAEPARKRAERITRAAHEGLAEGSVR